MATRLTSETPLADLQRVIRDFDRRHPNAFDDEAVEYISRRDDVVLKLVARLVFLCASALLSYLLWLDEPKTLLTLTLAAAAAAFALLMLWKVCADLAKISSGKRALERCVERGSIDRKDVRDVRQAYKLIRSWRDRQTNRNGGSSCGYVGFGPGGRRDSDGGGGDSDGGGGGGCGSG